MQYMKLVPLLVPFTVCQPIAKSCRPLTQCARISKLLPSSRNINKNTSSAGVRNIHSQCGFWCAKRCDDNRNTTAMAQNGMETSDTVISVKEVSRFAEDCMVAVGTPQKHAKALADILIAADYRGHYSHGLNRLGK